MIEIDLVRLDSDFFGIIIPRPSGIVWCTQAGGTACRHPQLEGIFVPLDGGPSDGTDSKDPLYDRVCEYDTALVLKFLNAHPLLKKNFTPIYDSSAPLTKLLGPYPLNEAWVPVRITTKSDTHVLQPFYGEWGVLVYPNSD